MDWRGVCHIRNAVVAIYGASGQELGPVPILELSKLRKVQGLWIRLAVSATAYGMSASGAA
jgi:hypothetical protein